MDTVINMAQILAIAVIAIRVQSRYQFVKWSKLNDASWLIIKDMFFDGKTKRKHLNDRGGAIIRFDQEHHKCDYVHINVDPFAIGNKNNPHVGIRRPLLYLVGFMTRLNDNGTYVIAASVAMTILYESYWSPDKFVVNSFGSPYLMAYMMACIGSKLNPEPLIKNRIKQVYIPVCVCYIAAFILGMLGYFAILMIFP